MAERSAIDLYRRRQRDERIPTDSSIPVSEQQEDRLYVVEITRESRQAFLDEHPEIRAALARAQQEKEAEKAKGATP